MQLPHQILKSCNNRRGCGTVKSGWGFSSQLHFWFVEAVAVATQRSQAEAGF